MELLKCVILYFRTFFSWVFKRSGEKRLAFIGMVKPHSYRLDKHAHHDPIIGLRYLKKALVLIWNTKEDYHKFEPATEYAVFDGSYRHLDSRRKYLELITGKKVCLFISKEKLGVAHGILARILNTIILLLLSIFIVPVTIFHPDRGSIALNLLEIVECAHLMEILTRNQIKYLYYFCAFNKDSNYVALRMKALGISSHKVPSSNPINNFYKEVVSDAFSFTAPFQHRELSQLHKNWFVENFEEWPVFNFQDIHPLIAQYQEPKKHTLALISSGIWKRIKRGDLPLGVGEYQAEIRLIEFLKSYLKKHPEIEFYIYFHPVEKSNLETYQDAISFYSEEFDGIDVNFFDRNTDTYTLFDKIDTSIAAYSSTNLERLYAGFKTLYAPLGMRTDYYAGCEVENIAAFKESDLEVLLDKTLNQETEDFFKSNDIGKYHHSHYDHLFKK